MTVEAFLVVALVLIIAVYTFLEWQKALKFSEIPAVRPRLPFVGNAWTLLSNSKTRPAYQVLTDWAAVNGPVYRVRLYNQEVLVLNSFEAIHHALVVKGSDFAGRPSMSRTLVGDRHENSIVWQTYTHKLQFLRKEVLRSFKASRERSDGRLPGQRALPEVEMLLESMSQHGGESFDPWDHVYDAVSNVMMGLIMDQQFESCSQGFEELREINRLFNEIYSPGNVGVDYLPFLRRVRHHIYYKKLNNALALRDRFWERELGKLKVRGHKNGIVSRLLALASTDKGRAHDVNEKTAKEVFTNLILAGTDTTTTALTCLFLVFLHQPEVQDRMWEEIRRSVGGQRAVRLGDREVLPYCQAVLLELLRFASHVPLGVPHCAVRETSVLGITVPKDMTVYINLWSLHHSPSHWHDPWAFQPSRFLDASGQLVLPSHPSRRMLLAFGAGRRVCLGEVLARNRLFLFATSLVQRFRFLPGVGGQGKIPPLDPRQFRVGLTIHPAPFQISVQPRSPTSDDANNPVTAQDSA